MEEWKNGTMEEWNNGIVECRNDGEGKKQKGDEIIKSPKTVTPVETGVQTSSRPRIKYGVNSSREPSQKLDLGFHRGPWIQGFCLRPNLFLLRSAHRGHTRTSADCIVRLPMTRGLLSLGRPNLRPPLTGVTTPLRNHHIFLSKKGRC